MRNILYILLLFPVLTFGQVALTDGNDGFFKVSVDGGTTYSYAKGQYETYKDNSGRIGLKNINNGVSITINPKYYYDWTINGNTPVSAQRLIDTLAKYIFTPSSSNPSTVLISGVNDLGNSEPFSITSEGHMEVAIHSPILPFGSIHTEKLTPVVQADAVYGLNPFLNNTTTGLSFGTGTTSGTVVGTNNMFTCATGTTQYSFATLQSRRRLRYRPGQGVVARFAGLFSHGVSGSISVAGIGTAEAGFYFGQRNDTFGILHVTGGVRELHTFTISTASTSTNSYRVYLPNGDSVSVTATSNSSTTQTAYEISQGTFPGWTATSRGSTVIFLAASVGNKTGSFTLAQPGAVTPAAGSDAETTAGVASTDTWYMQKDWNGDKLDGTGASGVTLDFTKGNVYQIGVQYLGFGNIKFEIEIDPEGNNPYFAIVHTLRFPNTLTGVHTSQPSFPFTMAAYSAGSTTNVSVSIGSYAG